MNKREPTAGQQPRTNDSENHNNDSSELEAAAVEPKVPSSKDESSAPAIEEGAPSSQVDALIQIGEEGCDLFHDRVDTPYARIGTGTVLRVEGSGFTRWLQSEFRRRTKRAANLASLKAAIHQIAATACFDGAEWPVHLRVAESDSGITLHLGNDDARSALVSASGCKIGTALVAFEKKRQARMLPEPVSGGELGALKQLLNHGGESNLKLIVGWLLMNLKETGPKPILIPAGSTRFSEDDDD